jgi:hypothetical protein
MEVLVCKKRLFLEMSLGDSKGLLIRITSVVVIFLSKLMRGDRKVLSEVCTSVTLILVCFRWKKQAFYQKLFGDLLEHFCEKCA